MMWNFLEQRNFVADFWPSVRYVAKMDSRIFSLPIFLIVIFDEGIVGFKVAEGLTTLEDSKPHSSLGPFLGRIIFGFRA